MFKPKPKEEIDKNYRKPVQKDDATWKKNLKKNPPKTKN